MTPATQALGERAKACKGFRWMAGMLDSTGRRVSWLIEEHALAGGIRDGDHRVRPGNCAVHAGAVPDFDDAATRGCLLQLVRQAWMDDHVSSQWAMRREWRIRHHDGAVLGADPDEAEALVVALEAAP